MLDPCLHRARLRPMERTIVANVLESVEGIDKTGGQYQVPEGHRLTFHVGEPGSALLVPDIASCSLHEQYIEAWSRNEGEVFYFSYDGLCALSCRPPKNSQVKRAGFA